MPTPVAQVHDDVLTYPSDVQTIYDNIAAVAQLAGVNHAAVQPNPLGRTR